MRWLLGALLAAVALGQQDDRKPEPEPAAAPEIEIVAPVDDWYDAERFAAMVAETRKLVEKHSGLAYREPPRVRIADHASWLQLVARELPDTRDPERAAAVTLGLFVPGGEGVVLGPVTGKALFGYDEDPERDSFAWGRTSLAHEMTHALQQQHFRLPQRMRAESRFEQKWVLRALTEGFAFVVEERIAVAEYGLSDYGERRVKILVRNRRLEYVRGRSYFAHLAARGGDAAMLAAMRDEPPTLAEFVKVALRKPAKAKTR